MIYLIIFISLLFLSFHYDICEKTKNRVFWYNLIMIVLILVAGLRWRLGGDTSRSLDQFYYETSNITEFKIEDYSIGNNPLYRLLMSFVYTIGCRFYVFQIIESAFVNVLLFKYFRKHSQYIFTCVFFYFISEYLYMNMEILKAAFSIVLCLYANDYLLEKKWMKAYLLIFISILFHPQALVVVLSPLFLFLRVNKYGALIILLSYFSGYLIQISIGPYLDLLGGIGDVDVAIGKKISSYGQSEYVEVHPFISKLKNYYPLIVYTIWAAFYVKYKYAKEIINKHQPFLMLGLIFLMIQMNVPIFYRLVEIYKIYFILYISTAVVKMITRQKRIGIPIAYMRTFLLISPLIFCMMFGTIINPIGRIRFIPYTSIFDREIIHKREIVYHGEDMSDFSIANRNNY